MRHLRPALLLAGILACGGDRSRAPVSTDSTPPSDGVIYRYSAVQLGAFADSGNAARFRDSLDRAGWAAQTRRVGRRWRVQVAPTRQLAYIQVLRYALRQAVGDSGIRVVYDSGDAPRSRLAGFTRVNYGAHGMAARVRWALSPDRRAIVVVEDPAAVENDPLPNGVFFASEAALRSVQLDSVWDAAPDPAWRRLAMGRAYLLLPRPGGREGESDSLERARIAALADTFETTTAGVRRAAFPASGMSLMLGWAQPAMVTLDSGAPEPLVGRVRYPVAAGWRVGWSPDGGRILAGMPPAHPRDDTPAERWVSVDPESGDTSTVKGLPDRARIPWVNGPTLDISVPTTTNRQIVIPTAQGAITSLGGWIRLNGRILGPGVALTATAAGHYIVALVPNPSAGPGEPPEMLAVYTILP